MTTLHNFGGVLGRRALDIFFWALTISWSWLLARVGSGPKHGRQIRQARAHQLSQGPLQASLFGSIYIHQEPFTL